MTNIAQHIRIFDSSPTDDLVTKRTSSISALADAFKKRSSWADMIGLGNEIANVFAPHGKLSEALVTQVADAIGAQSSSFDKDERPEEVKVCAALGVLTWLDGSSNSTGRATRADIVALATWSALSFQKPSTNLKIERLRQDLISVSQRLVLTSAETARQRSKVPDTVPGVVDGDTGAQIEKKIGDSIGKSIEALRLNAALDREEIDVLWWALSDWSKIGNKRYSTLGAEEAVLAGAVELASLLRRLPADVHRHLMIRHVANPAQKRDLPGFLEKLGDTREAVVNVYEGNSHIGASPHVFPLFSALPAADPKPSGGKVSRTLDEWGARALLEAGLLQLTTVPTLLT